METKTMNAIFSENLRNRLYLKRMTQGELAKKLGVSEASVSKWCLGDAMPRPKKIDQICVLLGCNIEDLTTDHTREVELAPEDVIAEEIRENPRLFKLMMYASHLSNAEIDELIARIKK